VTARLRQLFLGRTVILASLRFPEPDDLVILATRAPVEGELVQDLLFLLLLNTRPQVLLPDALGVSEVASQNLTVFFEVDEFFLLVEVVCRTVAGRHGFLLLE